MYCAAELFCGEGSSVKVSAPHQQRLVESHRAANAGLSKDRFIWPKPEETVGVCWIKSADVWAEKELGEGWIGACRFAVQEGKPVLAELRIFPDVWASGSRPPGSWAGEYLGAEAEGVPPGGLTSATVRSMTLSSAYMEALKAVSRLQERIPAMFGPRAILGRITRTAAESPRRLSDRTLARVAKTFVDAGCSVVGAAKTLRLKPTQARGRIMLARRRGLLTSSGKSGVRGASLTAAARTILG